MCRKNSEFYFFLSIDYIILPLAHAHANARALALAHSQSRIQKNSLKKKSQEFLVPSIGTPSENHVLPMVMTQANFKKKWCQQVLSCFNMSLKTLKSITQQQYLLPISVKHNIKSHHLSNFTYIFSLLQHKLPKHTDFGTIMDIKMRTQNGKICCFLRRSSFHRK